MFISSLWAVLHETCEIWFYHWNINRFHNNRDLTCRKAIPKLQSGNILLCKSGEYISSQVICDGMKHCQSGDDELNCTDICERNATEFSSRCKKRCPVDGRCQCSPLYFMDRNGTCKIFRNQYSQQSVSVSSSQEVWHCRNNRTIPGSHFNDIIPDCKESEDEPLLTSLLKNRQSRESLCLIPGQLPCLAGHSSCFNISDICVYSLDTFNQLIPCRTGSHLMVCETFMCNNKYKCPGYYCLRFSYVCDGKNDCPFGEDEEECDNMSDCKDMFRCRGS